MIGKIIGAVAGRKAANMVGTKVGGPVGAALGYGLASSRLRGAALGGLAVMGGLALVKRLRGTSARAKRPFMSETGATDPGNSSLPHTNEDPMPAYAPRV